MCLKPSPGFLSGRRNERSPAATVDVHLTFCLLCCSDNIFLKPQKKNISSFPYLEKEQTDVRELHTYKAKESKNEEWNGGEGQQPAPA